MFENRRIFRFKINKQQGTGENLKLRSFVMCSPCLILIEKSNYRRQCGQRIWYGQKREKLYTNFWYETQKERGTSNNWI
jgi:hypothetical protein